MRKALWGLVFKKDGPEEFGIQGFHLRGVPSVKLSLYTGLVPK